MMPYEFDSLFHKVIPSESSEYVDKLRVIGGDVTTIVRFIENGTPMGHFYTALFEGDLHKAVQRADTLNLEKLVDLTRWVYWYAPSGCVGRGRVSEWEGKGGLNSFRYSIAI